MAFIKITFQVQEPLADLLVAALDVLGYDGIVYEDAGFYAFIEEERFDEAALRQLAARYEGVYYEVTEVEDQNWNALWEKSFQPIEIGNQCIVRAGFHAIKKAYTYDIVIDPKQAFGTGHHATTHLVMHYQLGLDHAGKRVLDAGCGTGILSVLAVKRGATLVEMYDMDPLATENAAENMRINQCDGAVIYTGTLADVQPKLNSPYDIILANINKKVLLEDIPRYTALLSKNGRLIVSGFYESDKKPVVDVALKSYLRLLSEEVKDSWASIVFEKIT